MMNTFTFKYLQVLVVCFAAIFALAKSEPLPSEDDEDTGGLESEDDSDEYEYAAYYSTCPMGYEGQDCSTVTDNCERKEPCLNGGTCVNEINNYSCVCTNEFYGKDCEHLQNCRYPGTCSPPIKGGKCVTCRDGFVQDPDDVTSCTYANSDASLLVTFDGYLRMLSLDGQHIGNPIQFEENQLYSCSDYDFETNTVFWFSTNRNNIFAAPITHEPRDQIPLYNYGGTILALGVDWTYQHVYFTHTGKLFVSDFNGKMVKELLAFGRSDYSTSFAVNPFTGWIYWTNRVQWQILRAAMDGSNLTKRFIPDPNAPDPPRGLVIDLLENRLYWTQGRQIWSSDMDGLDSKLIFSENPSQDSSNFFEKISVFGKYLYLIEQQGRTIYRVNKCGGEELETFFVSNSDTNNYDMWDIKIFHATMQPKTENLCSKRRDDLKCSHFCFPVSNNGSVSVSTACGCPDGYSLFLDQLTCVENPKDED